MPEEFDVVVVGARCGGSPLAARLAGQGFAVCVVDRARFPSEVPSTHVLQPAAVAHLERMGLLDELAATGAPPLRSGLFVIDDVELSYGSEVSSRLASWPLCIRRSTLDTLLVRAADAAGADVRTGTEVRDLHVVDGVVRGVRTDGATLEAALVVGADGPSSVVARAVGAREYQVTPPGRVVVWAYWDGTAPTDEVRLGKIGDLGFLGAPTDGGLYLAAVAFDPEHRGTVAVDREQAYEAALRRVGRLDLPLSGGTRVGPVRVMGRWRGYFREAAGAGWALVGDAGHFKDPTPAQGISDALRHGERLAATIERGFRRGELDCELASWWRWRDADARDMYWFGSFLGAPGTTPRLAKEMLRRLGSDRDGPERFLRLMNREIPPTGVFGTGAALSALARTSAASPSALPGLVGEAGRLLADRVRQRHRAGWPEIPASNRGRAELFAATPHDSSTPALRPAVSPGSARGRC